MDGIFEVMFGRDRIFDWKYEYGDKLLRKLNERMPFGERMCDNLVKLVDCCVGFCYGIRDYFS